MKRLLILACVALFLTGCSTIDPVTGEKTRNFHSLDKDVQMGARVQNDTLTALREQGVPLNEDPVRVAQLQEMVDRIAAVSHLPDLPYEVTLIHTNIVNAMAAPGGKVMVYEGLWDPEKGLARDEDEIAAVMAHEIAHVNARHSTEAMTRAMPGNIFGTALMVAVSLLVEDSDNQKMYQTLIAGGMFVHNGVWMTKYSRVDELEADAVGMTYMAKAGYDPRAAVRIWERAAELRQGNDPAESIFSTHPPSAARVESLRQKLPEAMAIYEARQR